MGSTIGLRCELSFSALFKFLIILYAFIWCPCKSCSILNTNVSQHCLLIFLVSLFTIATNLVYSILIIIFINCNWVVTWWQFQNILLDSVDKDSSCFQSSF